MYIKLAIKNIQKSLKNYVIYFMTILIVVALMYSFVALVCSPDILLLSENMEAFKRVVIWMTGLASVMIAYVVGYAADFIINQRKKEFAVYSLLGVEKKYINRLFYIENLIIYIIAMVLGMFLGSILSGILAGGILGIFDIPHKYRVSVSMTPILYTMLFCTVMQIITDIRIVKKIKNKNIVDLLYESQKNEKVKAENPGKIKCIFLLAVMILGLGFWIIYYGLTCNLRSSWLYICAGIILLLASIYQVYRLAPILLAGWSKHLKGFNDKGANVFLSRQIGSRVNSAGRLMSAVAICLTIAMSIMSAGMAVGAGYKEQIAQYAPYDIALKIDADIADFDMELDYIREKTEIRDYVAYKLYQAEEYPELDILALSDYNHIRKQLQLKQVSVDGDRYMIHCEWIYLDSIMDKLKEGKGTIQIGGYALDPLEDEIHTEVMEQRWMVGNNGYAIIVPDEIAYKLPTEKSRLIVTADSAVDKGMKEELLRTISKHLKPFILDGELEKQTTIGVLVQSWTKANSLTGYTIFLFCSMYLGIVFIILICTLLGFRQLAMADKSKRQYILLWKLGFSKKEIEHLILKEMLIFFFIPLIMPFVVTAALMLVLNKIYMEQMAAANLIFQYASLAVAIFMLIYALYFVVTFIIYRKAALPKCN